MKYENAAVSLQNQFEESTFLDGYLWQTACYRSPTPMTFSVCHPMSFSYEQFPRNEPIKANGNGWYSTTP